MTDASAVPGDDPAGVAGLRRKGTPPGGTVGDGAPEAHPHVDTSRHGRADGRKVGIRRLDPRDLPPEAADRVLARMGDVMCRAVGGDGSGPAWALEYWRGRRQSILDLATVYLVTAGDEIVGFMAFRLRPLAGRRCLQLMSAYLLPEYQSRGIAYSITSRIILRTLLRSPFTNYVVVTETVNPIVVEAWRKHIRDRRYFYPDLPGDAPAAGVLREVATRVVEGDHPGATFDVDTGVLTGRTLPRVGPMQQSGIEEVDEYFESVLDPSTGQSILIVVDAPRRMVLSQAVELVRAAQRALVVSFRPRHQRGDADG